VGPTQSSGTAIERIAICTVGELFGGVERHVLGMLAALAARGINVLLVLFHDGELAAQARAMGADPVILANRNLAVLATASRLARILENRAIQVVHVHGYKATVFCAIARSWHPCAIVKTEHGLPEPTTGSPIHAWRDRLYHLLDGIATRAARAAVCYVTQDLQAHHRQAHMGLRTAVIPNGVESMDRPRFPRPPELREDRLNLLIVGRLDMVKGHHLAIEAIASRNVPSDVHLQILGVGPRRQELEALVGTRGIPDRVHLLGFRRNVYDYIANCDGLLMPSLHEGLPYTLLEAMALGTPVIASRVGGLVEVVQDEVTGLLVTPGNAAALANAIQRLIVEPTLRARLGEAAQRLQRAKYSLEGMASSYLDIYREVFASH
jgi:glycosyltransferase involved in cell wall biosynthesis